MVRNEVSFRDFRFVSFKSKHSRKQNSLAHLPLGILDNTGGETSSTGALATSVNADGCHLLYKFEELTLCRGGVPKEQDVNVSPEPHSVGEALRRPPQELADNRFLDVHGVLAGDGGSNGAAEDLVDVRAAGQGEEGLLLARSE